VTKANFYRAELIERIDFTEDLVLFRFRPEEGVSFRPGQYATIAVEEEGEFRQRPYSIVSSPYEPFLEFFVELVPHGEVTPTLWKLRVGDVVSVRNRIAGHFTLEEEIGITRHIMVATVSGVAPFLSMIRTQRIEMQRGKLSPHRFILLHGASRSWEFGTYKDELIGIACDGWLTYIPVVSRPWEDVEWKGETGRVEDVVRKYADQLGFDHTNAIAYACGHPQMIENVKGILARARFPKERIRDERFFTIEESKTK
jgi:ferredoxin--NADP+ reductase